MKRIVVAIGGNALNKPNEKPTAEIMEKNLLSTTSYLADLVEDGYELIITHGNGPQVGNLLVQQDMSKDVFPPFPIDVNDAMTQGSIGYLITQTLNNELLKRGKRRDIACVLTQIVVDKEDEGFLHPSKPVGPFYDEKTAKELERTKGWTVKEDAGRGFRRVVPSPIPLDVLEIEPIREMINDGTIVVAAGGGGIPVARDERGMIKGVEAVIDKDRASALLAKLIDADALVILTGVDHAYINFGKKDQRELKVVTVEEGKMLIDAGHFAKGSMLPKIESAIEFASRTGKEAIITSLEKVDLALRGKSGTRIIP
ncbi:carbamate kinase [Mesotoga sp.]|uniref:carbamate kinase n=1 Tax=Mesotoga sp. TaxID=2053577 RepID=UPI001BD66C66|nr:carbamate kinase [Mesotoga sp.]